MSNRTEISTLGEFGLIRHLTDRIEIKNNSTIKGVGDDAAISPMRIDKCLSPPIYYWKVFIST